MKWRACAASGCAVLGCAVLGCAALGCGDPAVPVPPAPTVVSTSSSGAPAPSAASSALAAESDTGEKVGPPHLATTVVRVLRGERDVLVVVLDNAKPGLFGILILDALTDRVAFRKGWDAVIHGQTNVVYGAQREVAAASRLGVPLANGDMYEHDGSKWFVQPIVFDLTTGRESALPLAGAARLARDGERTVALKHPGTAPSEGAKPYELDVKAAAWRTLDNKAAARALAVLGESKPIDAEVGWMVKTRDGRLGVKRVDSEHVQALRISVTAEQQ